MSTAADVFLVEMCLHGILASLNVFVEDEFKIVAPNDRFHIMFLYTLGFPKADKDRPFTVDWSIDGDAVRGVHAPRNPSFNPITPQHIKTVQDQAIDVGPDEYQIGNLWATAPNVKLKTLKEDLDIKGTITMYQPYHPDL